MLHIPKNKVAIQLIKDSDKIGSLYIPDIAKERADQGIVKYIGEECTFVAPGDYVIFSGYQGTLVLLEGEGALCIMREDFITAILDKVPNLEVPGLYFADDEEFFPANYEQAIELLADTYRNSDFRRSTRIKNKIDSRKN